MTEQEIEQALIEKLGDLKYSYRPDIRDRAVLEHNFRQHFESLNRVHLTDSEFARLLEEIITPDVFAAARHLRERNSFNRDDGTPLYYTLVNIKDWCKNSFEVINQLRINTDYSHHRYDVILLINGVPAVQIELKTLQISPRKAMQQIVDYKNDPGNGYAKTLLCFLQLFIVSNRGDTWYFANNNTRHFSFNADERFLPLYQFAGEDNNKITHLDSFAEKFLAKCTLGEMISRYMVLVASEQKLMMMRPYQIYAVKAIVECIHQHCGNGYIWHTTGSGKTLTSFKASTLLKDNPDIDKCLFVVDRKDLDRQTREEFNKFQEGCVEENTNTETLVRRLLSDDYADKVIVTTIQKLGLALDGTNKRNYKERLEPLRQQRMVFIFDECHRSQFGDNHKAIKEFFPNAQLFGFTGTPIFDQNANYQQIEGQQASYKTTADIFQQQLHAYTITHAIEDRNVLKFHVGLLQARGQEPAQAGRSLGQARHRRGDSDQARCRHRRAQIQRGFGNAVHQRCHRISRTVQDNAGRKAGRRWGLPAAQHRLRLLTARRRQQGRAADSGRPAAGKGRQRAGTRQEEGSPQVHHRRLQHPLWQQSQRGRVRPLLSGCAKAHQGPAIPQQRPAAQQEDRHHYRGGYAAHWLRLQVPEYPLRGQEPQVPRPDSGVLAHQPHTQRHQALRQHPRLSPAAGSRGYRHRPLLRRGGQTGQGNLAGGQGPGGDRKIRKSSRSDGAVYAAKRFGLRAASRLQPEG
ncbi:Type I restriction enzyme R Protein (modular protein) [Georgfuchsia toluolica]|uniref:Type I restriction enzyme endonuclease subunit n=1 Tax=Georgfuchsia toluolica TaxID=424218 RepID=A0A916J575_9PROT|nr:HsdR family type I site-specific deoxyribonuclease [Georgfuchsia toluolica]CAG4883648.1 Type I restriction enzyme R Protein (modular protein) [Georgfuchsia toluolica]